MPTRAFRPCVVCGTPCERGRCDDHPRVDTRGTRTERGYDAEYYRLVPLVLERDGYTCQLCMQPIYPTEHAPRTKWAPSVDHIIPVSHGGETSMENLRAAHYGCNSARGNREARSA